MALKNRRKDDTELYETVYEDIGVGWVAQNLQMLQNILQCIRSGDITRIQALIHVIPPEFDARLGSTPVRHTKNLVISLIQIMAVTAMDTGVSAPLCIRYAERMTRQAEETESMQELMKIADQAKLQYCEMCSELTEPDISDYRIRRAVQYINAHMTEKIGRKELAEAAGMSEEYFSRRFRQVTGRTAAAYIQHVRIQQAKRMLVSTDESLVEISSYLSFSSQNYFQRVFRKHENCTPMQYRQRNR